MHIHSLLLGCPECWQSRLRHVARRINNASLLAARDRKSTRLNSSHLVISYAVFCLKKKKTLLPTPPLDLHPTYPYRDPVLRPRLHRITRAGPAGHTTPCRTAQDRRRIGPRVPPGIP